MELNNTSLMNEINKLKSENESLKAQLSINKNIIQEFFKKNFINDKMPTIIANIQKENKLLQSQIENFKKENISKKPDKNLNKNKNDMEMYECKLFVYENMLKEKQNIIVSLKEQINNMKTNFLSNFKNKKNLNDNDELNLKNSPITTNNININENENNDNNKDKFVLEEICVIPPDKALNSLNSKIELYKSVNIKLKKIIKDLKEALSNKETEYLNLEENVSKMQKELEKCNRNKNNEEIINKLIQYQSMKKLPISQSCSNFNIQEKNFYFNEKNQKKLNNAKSSAYLNNKKIFKEIENLENLNKKIKEITDENLVLNGGWEETLKYCNMTQEEFSKYFNMRSNSKLASAIEYLYTILIKKNIQIKLLTQENEALNEENIRLNKLNIELESSIDFNNNNKIRRSRNKKINNNILFQNNENILYKTYKNNFINAPPSPNKNTQTNDKEIQKAYVNVDNNISHTNININMMMDYDYKKKINHKNNFNSLSSGEFRDGMLLDDMSDFNTNTNLKIITEPTIPHTIYKNNNYEKILKPNFKKINSKSQSKLILNKKQFRNKTPYNLKKNNLSLKNFSPGKNITSDSNINNKLEYNTIIKNIFNKTDKSLTHQSINIVKKNNNNKKQFFKFNGYNLPKKKEEINSNINTNVASNINSNLNTLKLFHNKERYKTNLISSNNNGIKKISKYNNYKNDNNNKAFEVFRKYIKEYTKNSQKKIKAK